ncbi:MAG: hypothetical protein HYV63_03660 [Candidatus Schekmanbacteria bacterium]|nr:hypothetical protein [Candidatus Schekmanbacteria bacterium]
MTTRNLTSVATICISLLLVPLLAVDAHAGRHQITRVYSEAESRAALSQLDATSAFQYPQRQRSISLNLPDGRTVLITENLIGRASIRVADNQYVLLTKQLVEELQTGN